MCDTIVAIPDATKDKTVILAKNSDREPNEVQLLMRLPRENHPAGASLNCTYLTIPQVEKTNEVLISRPFWMWGCEMGVNNHGLAIGNEAVFTREPYRKTGLTGMDLIRLALERAATAGEALRCVTELLDRYGQGGNCGYKAALKYHNSFIIADTREAWVLETADAHWAAEKVRGVRTISNGLTIEGDYDLSSKGLEDYALKKGYLKKHEPFSFKKAFSDSFYTYFSKCAIRRSRTTELLNAHYGKLTPELMMSFLRDHGHDDRYPYPHETSMGTVCMHASFGPLRPSQSTSALVAHLRKKLPVYWATASSGTCTGVFKPFYLTGAPLDFLPHESGARFDPSIPWWRHEQLHRRALEKYSFWRETLSPERDSLEKKFMDREKTVSSPKTGTAQTKKIAGFSEACFTEAEEKTGEWIEALKRAPRESGAPLRFRYFWSSQNRKAGMGL